MIRHPLHRGCNDQASSTQGVSMIKHPLHRGCHDQASSTQGVCHDQVSLYIGGLS